MDRTVLIPLGEYLFTVDLPSTFWLSAASGKSSYRHSHAGYEVSCLREGRCGVPSAGGVRAPGHRPALHRL